MLEKYRLKKYPEDMKEFVKNKTVSQIRIELREIRNHNLKLLAAQYKIARWVLIFTVILASAAPLIIFWSYK